MPSGQTNVPWSVDLSNTKSLFDYDVLVANMQSILSQTSPIWLVQKDLVLTKEFEARRLLGQGGIIVCLMAPPVEQSFLDIRAGSYDWIPIPGLDRIVKTG